MGKLRHFSLALFLHGFSFGMDSVHNQLELKDVNRDCLNNIASYLPFKGEESDLDFALRIKAGIQASSNLSFRIGFKNDITYFVDREGALVEFKKENKKLLNARDGRSNVALFSLSANHSKIIALEKGINQSGGRDSVFYLIDSKTYEVSPFNLPKGLIDKTTKQVYPDELENYLNGGSYYLSNYYKEPTRLYEWQKDWAALGISSQGTDILLANYDSVFHVDVQGQTYQCIKEISENSGQNNDPSFDQKYFKAVDFNWQGRKAGILFFEQPIAKKFIPKKTKKTNKKHRS